MVDDPTVKQRNVQDKAGAYAGTKKYGNAANLPEAVANAGRYANKRGSSPSPRSSRGEGCGRGKDRDLVAKKIVGVLRHETGRRLPLPRSRRLDEG